jgi:hypothetical protein
MFEGLIGHHEVIIWLNHDKSSLLQRNQCKTESIDLTQARSNGTEGFSVNGFSRLNLNARLSRTVKDITPYSLFASKLFVDRNSTAC